MEELTKDQKLVLVSVRKLWKIIDKDVIIFTHKRKSFYFCKAWNISLRNAEKMEKIASILGIKATIEKKGHWKSPTGYLINCIIRLPYVK